MVEKLKGYQMVVTTMQGSRVLGNVTYGFQAMDDNVAPYLARKLLDRILDLERKRNPRVDCVGVEVVVKTPVGNPINDKNPLEHKLVE